MNRLLLAAALMFGTAAANAATVAFELFDHPDAALFDPNAADPSPYGLRYDSEGFTFSFNTNLGGNGGPVRLLYDDAFPNNGVATIGGVVENNQEGTFWRLDYTLTGLSAFNGGFQAASGSGTLRELNGLGQVDPSLRLFSLTGELAGGSVFTFAPDGHRLDNSFDPNTPVGRGWILPPNSVDDFLFYAAPAPVPLPAAVWFLASALVIPAFARLRRR